MGRIRKLFVASVMFCLGAVLTSPLVAETQRTEKQLKDEVIQKVHKLQMPFIANEGQTDEQVRYYAKTFGGTVFVTKDGEIVYALPGRNSRQEPVTRCQESGVWKMGYGPRVTSNSMPSAPEILDLFMLSCVDPISKIVSTDTSMVPSCRLNQRGTTQDIRGIALKEEFVSGKIDEVQGIDRATTKVSYFRGNDLSRWKSNVSTYDGVTLGEVYKGIEVKLRAYGDNVEKLFCVKPGADPNQIKIRLHGIQHPESPFVKWDLTNSPLEKKARGLLVNEHGELEVETGIGTVKFTRPVAYQEIDGKRVEVECKYTMADCGMQNAESKINPKSKIQNLKSEYGFTVASYDKTKELVIDPLLASTFLGGSNDDFEDISSLAIDTGGNVYVAGSTDSSDFPTTPGAYDTSSNGNGWHEIFISRLNADLTSLLASTFLGQGFGASLAIDTGGNVYVAGITHSGAFPTTPGAYDTSHSGYGYGDAFISRLNADLTSLLASTFLGRVDLGVGGGVSSLAIDTGGSVYVAGFTEASDFPTTPGAYDTSFNGWYDTFISKLNGNLTSLLASTFLGGSSYEGVNSLAIDTGGNVYVAGSTDSSDFPTTPGAYDTSYSGGYYYDAFISRLNADLTSLLASTFLGRVEFGGGVSSLAIDTGGNVYVAGTTDSSDFPTTPGAYDTSFNGWYDTFISKLNGNLTSLLASTFLGGVSGDHCGSLAIDPGGKSGGTVYVAGYTESSAFPTTPGAYDTSFDGYRDAFISRLNADLTSLLASTFLGELSNGGVSSLAIDTGGNVYVAGSTDSTDFPTTPGAYDTSFDGHNEAFISRLNGNLLACSDDYESNDSFLTSYGPLTSGDSYTGMICNLSDEDYFRISVPSAGTVALTLDVPPNRDYDIYLYDPSYALVATSILEAGVDETINFDAAVPGTYYIHIFGYMGAYDENQTYTLSGTWLTTAPPTAPTNLQAESTSTSRISLRWTDNSTNETGFEIYRRVDAGAWTLITTTGANVTRYVDTAATGNTTTNSYSYYVRSCNGTGCSAETSAAVVPYRPTGLTATAISSSQINLSWTDMSSNERSFAIQRRTGSCTSGGAWATIATVGANITSYSDTGCASGTTYAYRIRATTRSARPYAYGYSMWSTCASATTP